MVVMVLKCSVLRRPGVVIASFIGVVDLIGRA